MLDCSSCKRDVPAQMRVTMACGFEPPAPRATPWQPLGLAWPEVGDRAPGPTVCAGYSTSLPEVREVMAAHVHWDKGTLRARYGGQHPTDALLDGLEILQGSIWELEAWTTRPKEER